MDFCKAFDSVWHKGLMFKLLSQYKIGGNFYRIIKNMSDNGKSCVKLPGETIKSFKLEKELSRETHLVHINLIFI